MALAPAGQGRDTCLRVTARLYAIAKAGDLDPADITARLKAVMVSRGWDTDEGRRGDTLADVNRTLSWAWQHAEPRGLS